MDRPSIKNRWRAIFGAPSVSAAKRAVRFSLRFSARSRLQFSLRRFFLKKIYRSKRQSQLVVPLGGLFGFKQLAVTLESRKRKKTQALRYAALGYVMLIVIGVGGAGYFSVEVFGAKVLEPVAQSELPAPKIQPAENDAPTFLAASKPVDLHIPKIDLDAPISVVGQNQDGTVEVPDIFSNTTGWYKHSPTPGEQGPAVIVGHVDTLSGPSVFWRLRELTPGDTISVTRADGGTAKFRVDAVKQFKQSSFPTDEIYGNIAYAGLRLITCGGAYSWQTDSYSHNTVVFASSITENK